MKQIKVHTPPAQTTLPVHEQAARRHRTRTERPATAVTRTPKPPTPPVGARKTLDTRTIHDWNKFR